MLKRNCFHRYLFYAVQRLFAGITNSLNLEHSEKELIQRALDECGNNRAAAARALGISRRTLYRKLEELGIKDKE